MVAVPQRAPKPNVVCKPSVVGGEPHVEGTRVPVTAVVVMYEACHQDVNMVYRKLGTLPPGGAEAALDYYKLHRDEIDALIQEHERDTNS